MLTTRLVSFEIAAKTQGCMIRYNIWQVTTYGASYYTSTTYLDKLATSFQ